MSPFFRGDYNPGVFSRKDKKEIRRITIKQCALGFKELFETFPENPRIELIEDFDFLLNDFYWHLFENRIAPFVIDSASKRINRFKIVSGLEISIMRILPFRTFDESLINEINANFAFTVSKEILIYWSNHKESLRIKEFNEEHLHWLSNLDTYTQLPIFSNAQTYRLFDYLLKIKSDVIHSPIHEQHEIQKEIRSIFGLFETGKY